MPYIVHRVERGVVSEHLHEPFKAAQKVYWRLAKDNPELVVWWYHAGARLYPIEFHDRNDGGLRDRVNRRYLAATFDPKTVNCLAERVKGTTLDEVVESVGFWGLLPAALRTLQKNVFKRPYIMIDLHDGRTLVVRDRLVPLPDARNVPERGWRRS